MKTEKVEITKKVDEENDLEENLEDLERNSYEDVEEENYLEDEDKKSGNY